MNKPHCYGKMDWILKYPEDEVPQSSICNCNYTNSCFRLTRNNADKEKSSQGRQSQKSQ
jgi:hypothetical protein